MQEFTFNVDFFCQDLATKLPRVWKHVLGLQTLNHNKQMELNFDQDEPMTYLQQNGLDRHGLRTRPTKGNDGVSMGNTPGNAGNIGR